MGPIIAAHPQLMSTENAINLSTAQLPRTIQPTFLHNVGTKITLNSIKQTSVCRGWHDYLL